MARGEGVKPIKDLFQKYRDVLVAPQASVVAVFCEVVEDVCGFSIKPTQVEYVVTKKLLILKTPAAVRTEVLLHKEEVLNHVKGRLGEKGAPVAIL